MVWPGDEGRNVLVIAVTLFAVLAFGWYVVSAQIARQRGAALARSSFDLVRSLGSAGRPTWLRGGSCQFSIEGLRTPLTRVQVVSRPAPRAFLIPIPGLSRTADGRDLVAFALDVTRPPTTAFDLVEARSSVGLRALQRAARTGWQSEDWTLGGRPMLLLSPDLTQAKDFLRHSPRAPSETALEVVRLAVSPAKPHLSVTVVFNEGLASTGPRFASWLTRVADYVNKSSSEKMV
jgi:hypothetical protein